MWALALAALLLGGCQVVLADMPAVVALPTLAPTANLNSPSGYPSTVPSAEISGTVLPAANPDAAQLAVQLKLDHASLHIGTR